LPVDGVKFNTCNPASEYRCQRFTYNPKEEAISIEMAFLILRIYVVIYKDKHDKLTIVNMGAPIKRSKIKVRVL
jgi:hypothetical protein